VLPRLAALRCSEPSLKFDHARLSGADPRGDFVSVASAGTPPEGPQPVLVCLELFASPGPLGQETLALG